MIIKLFTGEDGESHFEEIDLQYEAKGLQSLTDLEPVEGIMFRIQKAGAFYDFHPAPRRQYLVSLHGLVEIGLGSGEKRIFHPGDVMLADDLTGRGHTTRIIGGEDRLSIVIPV